MAGKGKLDCIFTAHARLEMARRGLSQELVDSVLAQPGQRWNVRPGRALLQSKVLMGEAGTEYLLRVIVDVDRAPPEVVTAYRTSKIAKYWRQQP